MAHLLRVPETEPASMQKQHAAQPEKTKCEAYMMMLTFVVSLTVMDDQMLSV